jgi:glyoxalase family protein
MFRATPREETMAGDILGLHHVTAIAGEAQRIHDFYAGALGLRFVKKTVNFDDPSAYHLYYADRTGSAGTVMTFFAWPGARRGAVGVGQAGVTQFAVPPGSLAFWRARLAKRGATLLDRAAPFGEAAAYVADPDGLVLMLVEAEDPRAPWTTDEIGADAAVRGFRGVTLTLRHGEGVGRVLTEAFGYRVAAQDGGVTRYALEGSPAGVVDVEADPAAAAGREWAGVVHHVAFAVKDRTAQLRVRAAMEAAGLRVTPQIDRDYFWAIYSRTPGGVLFEVATEEPGFAVDEPVEKLGTGLMLPKQHAHLRAAIEAALPPLRT